MNPEEYLDIGFLFALLWQTTLALCAGWVLYVLLRERPARAHFAVLLALIASIALPAAWYAVRHTGAGVLPPPIQTRVQTPVMPRWAESTAASAPSVDQQSHSPRDYTKVIGVVWLAIAALLLARLALGFFTGIRMFAKSEPLVSERLYKIMESARTSLDVRRPPIAFVTDAVRCPAIWCWAVHPSILLPKSLLQSPGGLDDRQWFSIFAHELAHLRRRDHFAAVIAEFVCALLWWNPLAWLCRARLNDLSDEACDRWVVSIGKQPEAYAETLIAMLPQRRSLSALSMVSGKHTLKRRITAMLRAAEIPAIVGRRWILSILTITCCAIAGIACMQTPAPEQAEAQSTHATLALVNPGIETGSTAPDAWSRGANVEGVEYEWDRTTAKSGSASLRLRKTAQRYFPIAEWKQPLSITPSESAQKIRVGAWVKAEQAYKATIDLQYTDAQGEWKHEWAAYIGAKNNGDPPANHGWQYYSGEIELPAGATQLTVGLQIYGPGTVWFDDIALAPA